MARALAVAACFAVAERLVLGSRNGGQSDAPVVVQEWPISVHWLCPADLKQGIMRINMCILLFAGYIVVDRERLTGRIWISRPLARCEATWQLTTRARHDRATSTA